MIYRPRSQCKSSEQYQRGNHQLGDSGGRMYKMSKKKYVTIQWTKNPVNLWGTSNSLKARRSHASGYETASIEMRRYGDNSSKYNIQYLGVMIDRGLLWTEHYRYLRKKEEEEKIMYSAEEGHSGNKQTIAIYTDGSKLDGALGVVVVVYKQEEVIWPAQERLKDKCSVFQAKLRTINVVLNRAITQKHVFRGIDLYSDTLKATIRAEHNNHMTLKIYKTILRLEESFKEVWIKSSGG